jgi:hypothetical protein
LRSPLAGEGLQRLYLNQRLVLFLDCIKDVFVSHFPVILGPRGALSGFGMLSRNSRFGELNGKEIPVYAATGIRLQALDMPGYF